MVRHNQLQQLQQQRCDGALELSSPECQDALCLGVTSGCGVFQPPAVVSSSPDTRGNSEQEHGAVGRQGCIHVHRSERWWDLPDVGVGDQCHDHLAAEVGRARGEGGRGTGVGRALGLSVTAGHISGAACWRLRSHMPLQVVLRQPCSAKAS